MEQGFFHPKRGYWQTISGPPERIRRTYPVGTVEVPLKPGTGYTWDGTQWNAPPGPAAEEQRERMRCTPLQLRLALHRAGRLAEAEVIAGADPENAIVWEYATTLHRTSALMAAMTARAFSDAELDDLFRAAMQLDNEGPITAGTTT